MENLDLIQAQYCLNSNLRKACRVVTQFYADMIKSTGLEKTQFTLLMVVSAKEPCTVTELAEFLVMNQTTATRNLQRLEKRDLIELSAGEDRRNRLITTTPEGKAVLAEAMPVWQQAQTKLVEGLGVEKTSQLLKLLSEVRFIVQQS